MEPEVKAWHLREVLQEVVGVRESADVGSHQQGGVETDDLAVGAG